MSAVPGADDFGFELLPEVEGISPEDDLAAAVDSALSDGIEQVSEEPPEPFGRSWALDFETGRFKRQGLSPAQVGGLDSLKQWVMLTLTVARGRLGSIYSSEYGMDGVDAEIGELASVEVISDIERRIADALMVHDRISAVTDFHTRADPVAGVIYIERFTIVTDEEERLAITDIQLSQD